MPQRPRKGSAATAAIQRALEPLEPRMLMSFATDGGQFPVNSFTPHIQALPSIASDADGDFVVVWESDGQDGSGSGIFAQRYNSSGAAQGAEFRVNSTTLYSQSAPAVAMDADGDFVVAWESRVAQGNYDIFAQRFNAAGKAQGGEFRVNTFRPGPQRSPAAGIDAGGNFVIAWQSDGQEGPVNLGVYARRFNALGQAQGDEFHVNTATSGNQIAPSVAMDADGDFAIVWSDSEIRAQRYSARGVAQGDEFRVNTFTTGNQFFPAIAMDARGDFVVAWQSSGQDGSLEGIYAQRFSAAGAPQGGEFRANTVTANAQKDAAVAMDAGGNFFITWSSDGQDGSGLGVYGQRFNAAAVVQGDEFRVNTTTAGAQGRSAVAMDANGDAVVAWHGPDVAVYGVYAQRYSESNSDTVAPVVGGVYVNGRRVLPYVTQQQPLTQIVVSFSDNMSDAGGTTGISSVTNPDNWLITRNGVPITSDLSITYSFNPTTNRYEALLNLGQPYTSGNFLVKARDTIRDAAGNRLDGNLNGAAGGSHVLPFSLGTHGRRREENLVNTYTTSVQYRPALAMSGDGNYVIVWESYQDGSGDGIYAQRYNAAGVKQGGEFRVNTYTIGDQINPAVAMNTSGDFVVAWQSEDQDGSKDGVYAQRFNAAGVPQGGEFKVNTFTTDVQYRPSVGMDASGDFVVAWQSWLQDGSSDGVYAQRFDLDGVPQGGEFRVNTYTNRQQRGASVAMDASGDFVVAWYSYSQDGAGYGVYAQRYTETGALQGGEFRVNVYTQGHQGTPSVAMDASGDFVVAWQSHTQDGNGYGIYARRFDAAGNPQDGDFKVNTFTNKDQEEPSVAMDADGDFVIAWQSDTQDGDYWGSYAQRYNAAGQAIGGELLANTYTTQRQRYPSVGMSDENQFVVVWESTYQLHLEDNYSQHFGLRPAPTVAMLSDSPDPVTGGNSITLVASGANSEDGTVTSVGFYRESNGDPGLQVGIEGDTLVGTSITNVNGFWSVNVSTVGLGAGTYTYYAQATDDIGLIGAPAMTSGSVVVGAAPSVFSSQFMYKTAPHKIAFQFDQDVSASVAMEDFVVQKVGGPAMTPDSFTYDPATHTVTLVFNTPLPNGRYTATALAAGITSTGGTPMAANHQLPFLFMRGDANNDGAVDVADLGILATNWQQSPRDFSHGDFDYSGTVDVADLGILASNWQQQLPAPSAAAAVDTTDPRQMRARTTPRLGLVQEL
jgi:hypothetical protein